MNARYDRGWVEGLLDTGVRLGKTMPAKLLRDSGLTEGMTVVDYGCGPGFFALPAAATVGPTGLVYAVDIEPRMGALVEERAREQGYGNLKAVQNEAETVPLPDAVADFALCTLVMHYADNHDGRVAIARELRRVLKPNAMALIIQRPSISSEETSEILTEAGFQCGDQQSFVDGTYAVVAISQ